MMVTTQNQLSVQIPRGKMAESEPSLIKEQLIPNAIYAVHQYTGKRHSNFVFCALNKF